MPDDTGTQYAGLTPMERSAVSADFHMRTCDAPTIADFAECQRRLDRIQAYLAVLLPAHRAQVLEEAAEALAPEIAWQQETYGTSADKVAIGRLIGVKDAQRTIRGLAATTPTDGPASTDTAQQPEVVPKEADDFRPMVGTVTEEDARLVARATGGRIRSADLPVPFDDADVVPEATPAGPGNEWALRIVFANGDEWYRHGSREECERRFAGYKPNPHHTTELVTCTVGPWTTVRRVPDFKAEATEWYCRCHPALVWSWHPTAMGGGTVRIMAVNPHGAYWTDDDGDRAEYHNVAELRHHHDVREDAEVWHDPNGAHQ